MEEWKSLLVERVSNIITSKRTTNFEEAALLFEMRFNMLTTEIVEKDASVIKIDRYDGKGASFSILHYQLDLLKTDKAIEVRIGTESNLETIAEVRFENGFAVVEVNTVNKKHYLSEKSIDALFKKAFSVLTKE
ncbi:hypothetical protein [Domibacillus iocasae]|uniref:DUF3942 domain-containing protein n=1 Tax=Domibacillus iocasae TaxID=1714016 RepID=A0A1E7DQM0_9BACI|nr:hypothetical protein [Domibacillus iocasae]OES45339.1 hypothetical protein BA724_04860 [Domibacillus iocasae]